jgi:hypothetical protein
MKVSLNRCDSGVGCPDVDQLIADRDEVRDLFRAERLRQENETSLGEARRG